MGVRASLPGDGSSKQMRVRFTAQWYSEGQQAWLPVKGAASSPWIDAGSAEYSYGQAGWTFGFAQPPSGKHYQLRGVAQMQWLSRGRVTRSASSVTRVASGVDVGGSQATCTLP
jgi:hypothetical protein